MDLQKPPRSDSLLLQGPRVAAPLRAARPRPRAAGSCAAPRARPARVSRRSGTASCPRQPCLLDAGPGRQGASGRRRGRAREVRRPPHAAAGLGRVKSACTHTHTGHKHSRSADLRAGTEAGTRRAGSVSPEHGEPPQAAEGAPRGTEPRERCEWAAPRSFPHPHENHSCGVSDGLSGVAAPGQSGGGCPA